MGPPALRRRGAGSRTFNRLRSRGSVTLEDAGAIMNLTRERIRQVEVKVIAKLAAIKDVGGLRDFVENLLRASHQPQ